MSDLKIKRDIGIRELEVLIKNPSTFEQSILMPNDLSESGALGVSAAFCQFLLTWARRSRSRTIKTFLKQDDHTNHSKFSGRMYGLCAAYFSKELHSIRSKGCTENIRSTVLNAASDRIVAMSRGELGSTCIGREIEFIFIQGARNQFHGSVYKSIPSPIEWEDRERHGRLIRTNLELDNFLNLCFDHLNVKNLIRKRIFKTDAIFGRILGEVFKNTAEHACQHFDGSKLDLNLRCIRIATSLLDREKIANKSISSSEGLIKAKEYFNKIGDTQAKEIGTKITVLEISVFDSGPGFARTFSKQEASEADIERNNVVNCFRKHHSGKKSKNVGMGLPEVVELISDTGGFIRIRTSTAEAFYCAGPEFPPDVDPDSFVYGGLPRVEGTVVTIGIPLIY
jgi:hypothetical protein